MKEYKYSIVIGRFQPIHKAHIELIKKALSEADECIVVIGSAFGPRTVKNPFTYEERKEMIESVEEINQDTKLHIIPARDYFYNDNLWIESIQQQIYNIVGDEERVCLVGAYKDSSSSYVNMFPQWDYRPFKITSDMNATKIRTKIFEENISSVEKSLCESVYNLIFYMLGEEWVKNLMLEYQYINKYKEQWSNAPYPPTFICADAVVIKSGHILVCRRGQNPGKGLYALPGGFVRQDEPLRLAAIRELKEETKIRLSKSVLIDKISEEKIFDYPGRSLRGRTITNAVYIDLGQGELPEISRKGGDDTDKAFWMQIRDAQRSEDEFFEDHFHIINYFVNRF